MGSYQHDVGLGVYTGVSQPSVSRVLHEVVEALNQPEIFKSWVKFPNTQEELKQLRKEYEKYILNVFNLINK